MIIVFSAFNDDHIRERETNCAMMERVAGAMNLLAPNLKSFVYSGGTRVRSNSPFSRSTVDRLFT